MLIFAAVAMLTLTPDDIMARTIAATRHDTAAWHERATILRKRITEFARSVNKEGELVEKWKPDAHEEFLLFGIDGRTMEQLKQRDGVSLPNEPAQPVGIDILRIITERAACYTFAFAKTHTDTHNGRPVYRLTFTPRSSPCDFQGDEEHIGVLTRGTLLVDQERFCIWRLEGELSASISKAIICSISEFHLIFEQVPTRDLIVPHRLTSTIRYGCFLKKKVVERRTVTYDTPAPKVP